MTASGVASTPRVALDDACLGGERAAALEQRSERDLERLGLGSAARGTQLRRRREPRGACAARATGPAVAPAPRVDPGVQRERGGRGACTATRPTTAPRPRQTHPAAASTPMSPATSAAIARCARASPTATTPATAAHASGSEREHGGHPAGLPRGWGAARRSLPPAGCAARWPRSRDAAPPRGRRRRRFGVRHPQPRSARHAGAASAPPTSSSNSPARPMAATPGRDLVAPGADRSQPLPGGAASVPRHLRRSTSPGPARRRGW